jgi:small conductance mechanosensitive channel
MAEEIEYFGRIAGFATEFVVNYGFQIIGAFLILVIGWLAANWLARLTMGLCERARLDITLSRFFSSLAKATVLVFVIIIALGKFGITITPLIAALGAVAFGSILALQGPLSNYGAGLTIILTRPRTSR